jgi:hypothetical protein
MISQFKQQKKDSFEAKYGSGKKPLAVIFKESNKKRKECYETIQFISAEGNVITSNDEGEECFLLLLNCLVISKLS